MAKLLSWSTAERPGSHFVAHGFPSSFQLDPADVRSGAVRVVAKAPSGQTFPMDVMETDGVYTTNFTPTEIGDWQVSILFEGDHIQGSPFNVRVYDPGLVKVGRLPIGFVGRPYEFSVDASEAGDGLVAVEVSHNDRNVQAQILGNYGSHKVSFVPSAGGQYSIQIYFAGHEVAGSPFTVTIVDSADVTVSGDGVGLMPVNQPTSFLVSMPRTNTAASDFEIDILSPWGAKISPRISNLGNGIHRVDYTPHEVGRHSIDIHVHSQPIIGSPFVAEVYDASRITVTGLRSNYSLGDSVTFDIDASNAGTGNLDIVINEGEVPCAVTKIGNKKYRATFSPQESRQHSVLIKFNGQRVIGSPWNVDVKNHQKASASETGMEFIPSGQVVRMELVQSSGSTGRLTANVRGPTGRHVMSNIFNQRKGVYALEFTPLEIGLHNIDVMMDGRPVPGSPFSRRVFSAEAVGVSQAPSGIVGSPVEFTVDVSKAGEGKLEIMINRGAVPNSVRNAGRGVYEVSFIPQNTQPHTVDITFNGISVPGVPFTVPIIDQSKVSVSGNGIIHAAVNQISLFHVDTHSAGDADLSVKVTALKPGGNIAVPTVIRGNSSKGYDVEFVTKQTGNYRVDVEYGGTVVKGSPFIIKSFDPSKIQVTGIGDGIVGQASTLSVNVEDAGEGDVSLSITSSSGNNIPNKVESHGSKHFDVHYTPVESGQHRINITFNGRPIPGNPLVFYVSDLSKLSVLGDGLGTVQCNKNNSFTITGPGLQQKDLDVQIKGPNGRTVNRQIFASAANSVTVEYLPTVPGDYEVAIKYHDHPIAGSPFTAHAWDHCKVLVSNIRPGRVLQESKFNIDASNAGVGNLETIVTCESESVPNFVTAEGRGHFAVSFTPLKGETHMINIKFNGESVPGNPFVCEVTGSSRLHPLSDGIVHIPNGRPATVTIDRGKEALDSSPIVCYVDSPLKTRTGVKISPLRGERMLKAEFLPQEIGQHCIHVLIKGEEIVGSPFLCEVYDATRVRVVRSGPAIVGRSCEFDVDLGEAGSGDLDVYVKNDRSKFPVKVVDKGNGISRFSFTPNKSGLHEMFVYFAKELIAGSPMLIDVQDVVQVEAKGPGLQYAHIGKEAVFHIAPFGASYITDLKILIHGPLPSHHVIPYEVKGNHRDGWKVTWLPLAIGMYSIEVRYGDGHVIDSPFKCKVCDLSKIRVYQDLSSTGIDVDGIPGADVVYVVDATQSGPGNLEVVVRSARDGSRIPNYLEAYDHSGKFRIYFTPRPDCFNYQVDVAFNEQPVTGSPFHHAVIDGRKATASGDGLGSVLARRPTSFDVVTRDVGGDATLFVEVIDSNGDPVSSQVNATASGFHVFYTPKIVGKYTVNVRYADAKIRGSPFHPEVYDPSCVRVTDVSNGIVGRQTSFKIDTSAAGDGHVTVKVSGQTSHPYVDISAKSDNCYTATFEPQEAGRHQAYVLYNDIQIPGSPFDFIVLDESSVAAKWPSSHLYPAHKPVQMELESKGTLHGKIVASVTDPYGKSVNCRVNTNGGNSIVEFVPAEVGPHCVEVFYGSEPIRGSPFTADVYDSSRVKLLNVPSLATAGEEVTLRIDTSESGLGDVDVSVVSNKITVPTHQDLMSKFCESVSFTPKRATDHLISVSFNGEKIPGSPFVLKVKNPVNLLEVINPNMEGIVVKSSACVLVEARGSAINPADLEVQITGPTGESLPFKLLEMSNGGCKIEYTCKNAGRYVFEIFYHGEAISGTPLYIEAFDPNRIQIDSKASWSVGEKVLIDVDQLNAGKADIGVFINGPRGASVPFDIFSSSQGHRIGYTPTEHGTYQTHLTYGGISIPGCPIIHNVMDSVLAMVSGSGLERGIRNRLTAFTVDSKGHRGELVVQVDGPNSIAKCNIEPGSNGTYRVNYVPVEVGKYKVIILWNGKPVEGSPFHPTIIDPSKVDLVGGWQSILKSNGCWPLTIHEPNTLIFETKHAGPGHLSAEVTHDGAVLPTDIKRLDPDHYHLTFVPRAAGEHVIKIFWGDVPLPCSPVIGMAVSPVERQHLLPSSASPTAVNSDKVILAGQGLHEAKVYQRAEFVIDGTEAGHGSPDIHMVGLNCDVDVQCIPLGGQKYRCSYIPTLPGAYLLNIMWANNSIRGSPFKVTVSGGNIASKVTFLGETLRSGIIGQVLRSDIDTRLAGSGELSAQCIGPTKPAFCELVDHRDGTFTLSIKPQEVGQHILEIKYGGEHIPGSPVNIKVSGSPDASKVTARGPGLQHGVLSNYQSQFVVDTTGAGAGQLTVRVRGPKDGFHVEMQRDKQKDRRIVCYFDPTEAGDYIVHVKWSGVHVPGSPFHVHIASTEAELAKFMGESAFLQFDSHKSTPSPQQYNNSLAYF